MILINGNKYSCLECIRGHRSSLCRHHMRPLLQVRSKGRPNFQFSSGNKNHRVAVFAEEVADGADAEKKDCKNTPVVILKTSDKHVIDISNGQIVGPYEGNSITFQPSRPLVKDDSFLNSSLCCSKGASRVRKVCQCNKEKVSKSKILRSYIDKKIKQQELAEAGCCSSSLQKPPTVRSCCSSKPADSGRDTLKSEQSPRLSPLGSHTPLQPSLVSNDHEAPKQSQVAPPMTLQVGSSATPAFSSNVFVSNSSNDVFQVINVPTCSLPGTCSCSSDCACPNCMTHNNLASEAKIMPGLDFRVSDSQFQSNLILTLAPSVPGDSLQSSGLQSNGLQSNGLQSNGLQSNGLQSSGLPSKGLPSNNNGTGTSFPPGPHMQPLFFPTSLAPNVYAPALALSGNMHQYQNSQPQHNFQFPSTILPAAHPEPQIDPFSNEGLMAPPQSHPQYPSALPKEYDFYNTILKQVIGSTILVAESSSTQPSEEDGSSCCACPDDNCGCNNCETHGIIDGYKLDDIFMSKLPLGEFQRNDPFTGEGSI